MFTLLSPRQGQPVIQRQVKARWPADLARQHAANALASSQKPITPGPTYGSSFSPVSSSVDELGSLINDTAKEFGVLIKELGIEQLD